MTLLSKIKPGFALSKAGLFESLYISPPQKVFTPEKGDAN